MLVHEEPLLIQELVDVGPSSRSACLSIALCA